MSLRSTPPRPHAPQVVKKAKLTKLVFNPKWPIILVGDDKGVVTCLKLSPNLRKTSIPQKGQTVRPSVSGGAAGRMSGVADMGPCRAVCTTAVFGAEVLHYGEVATAH